MKNLSIITKKDGHMTTKHAEVLKTFISTCGSAYAKGEKSFRLHLCRWTGSVSHLSLNDVKERAMLDLFRAFEFTNYRTGNDAPRGGKIGHYIELDTNDAVNFIGLNVALEFETVIIKCNGREIVSFKMYQS